MLGAARCLQLLKVQPAPLSCGFRGDRTAAATEDVAGGTALEILCTSWRFVLVNTTGVQM